MRSLSLNRSLKTKQTTTKKNLHESRGILEKKELGGKGKDERDNGRNFIQDYTYLHIYAYDYIYTHYIIHAWMYTYTHI